MRSLPSISGAKVLEEGIYFGAHFLGGRSPTVAPQSPRVIDSINVIEALMRP